MHYTTLGRTGLTVSTLGLGGASIGGSYGPVEDEPEALRTVQAAVDLGINFIDTAPLYGRGQSEERIGRALAECRGRDKVILATKVGYLPPGLGYDRATTVAAVEASLTRLQTDCVDLIQIHEVDRVPLAQAVEETLEGFRLLQAAGKVRFAGITGDNVAKLTLAADTGLFDAVQTFRHYTLTNQTAADELLPTAARHTMGVINGSPLGMGLLTGGDPHVMNRPAPPEVVARVDRMRELAQRLGISLPELAIRFSLSQPGISVTIPGTKSVVRLAENAAAWRAGPLPPDVLAEIARE
jgi:L-galactose dehydrogenase